MTTYTLRPAGSDDLTPADYRDIFTELRAENAYAKIKAECKPTTARAMWQCWYLDVMRRIEERASAAIITDDELDGDTDPVTAGDFIETPLFG